MYLIVFFTLEVTAVACKEQEQEENIYVRSQYMWITDYIAI